MKNIVFGLGGVIADLNIRGLQTCLIEPNSGIVGLVE